MADQRKPVFGITVIRHDDGTTELRPAYDIKTDPIELVTLPMPTDWQNKHAMLVDAVEQTERDAGVVPTGATR